MEKNIDYKAAYERQKLARQQAEDILETKARELFEKNQSLLDAYNKLKDQKAQLLHREKLASIGQLAAGVAHEINNPTGFVKGNINALKRYTDKFKKMMAYYDELLGTLDNSGGLPIELKKQCEETKKNLDINYIIEDLSDLLNESLSGIERIEDIVKGLKNFARPDSEKAEKFNINDCINNTLKLVWNEIKYKAELETKLQPVPDTYGYPGEISQVILNLLVNASQAIEDNGIITVTTKALPSELILTISDNGHGIAQDYINKIFDPFFTTKDVDTGTGLGLSITHGIIKKHKGKIEVNSQENKGTTFVIILPIINQPIPNKSE